MNAAEDVVSDEANELAGIFWFAHALPQPEGRHIQKLTRSYAQVVVEEEWPAMEQGSSSPKAWDTLDEPGPSWDSTLPRMPSKCPTAKRATTKCWSSSTAWETQGGEIAGRKGGGCPPSWWAATGGGVITIAFTYLLAWTTPWCTRSWWRPAKADDRPVAVHRGLPRSPLPGRRAYPPCGLRAGAREVSRRASSAASEVCETLVLGAERPYLRHGALGSSRLRPP